MSKKIGEVKASTGATWEVWSSLGGVEMAGGAPIEPDEASALARLLLDAAHESRLMRERAKVSALEAQLAIERAKPRVRPGHKPPCKAMLDSEAVCTCGQ